MRPIARAFVAIVILAGSAPGEAHKPVTSPYTFTEDVFPILRDQCGRCHVDGGVAPMPLLTFADTVPWGESIRVELMAGHMPPWDVDTPPSRSRNVNTLTARELDVLLTWAAGGTPPGPDPPASSSASARRTEREWSLGRPDLLLDFPAPVTLAANVQDQVEEITLHPGTSAPRWVRAADLMPGTPAIVRSATISVVPDAESPVDGKVPIERVLSVWLPGEDPVPLDAGAGFLLPAAADLRVRVHYRKTWRHERDTMTDRSRIGIYFVPGPANDLRALTLSPSAAEVASGRAAGRLVFSRTLQNDAAAVAIYPDANTGASRITVRAVRPDGSGEELIAFRAMRDWSRRYWYREPIALPRGTRLDVVATLEGESALLPPAAAPVSPADPAAIRLTVDLIASP
jgi:hypothetical protein